MRGHDVPEFYPEHFINGASYPVDYESLNTTIFFLSYQKRLNPQWHIKADLPYARIDFDTKIAHDYSFYHYAGYEHSVGNPYIGGQYTPTSWFAMRFGTRLPLLTENYIHISQFCAYAAMDRFEAFRKNASAQFMWTFQLRHKSGLGIQLENGFIYFFPRGHYRGPWWHIPANLSIGLVSKRLSLECFVHLRYDSRGIIRDYDHLAGMMGLAAAVQLGRLRPGFQTSLTTNGGAKIYNYGVILGYIIE